MQRISCGFVQHSSDSNYTWIQKCYMLKNLDKSKKNVLWKAGFSYLNSGSCC